MEPQEELNLTLSNLELTDEQRQNLLDITTELENIENQLKAYEEIQKSYETFREKLFKAMTEYGVTKYTSNAGIQFTVVSASPDKTKVILKFNVEKFKVEKPKLYKKYVEQVTETTKGKSSYLRITLPKGDE
jgi:flagellar capping protein FliD